jgi:hypothetical protein
MESENNLPDAILPLPLSRLRAKQAPPPMFLGIDMGHITDERPVLERTELRSDPLLSEKVTIRCA